MDTGNSGQLKGKTRYPGACFCQHCRSPKINRTAEKNIWKKDREND